MTGATALVVVEADGGSPVIAVQWHPELDASQAPVFDALVAAMRAGAADFVVKPAGAERLQASLSATYRFNDSVEAFADVLYSHNKADQIFSAPLTVGPGLRAYNPATGTPNGTEPAASGPGPNTAAAEPVEQPDRRDEPPTAELYEAPPRDRARAAALRHADRHGALPTVSELEALAAVSRGTAAAALKALRQHPTPLHLVHDTPDPRTQL